MRDVTAEDEGQLREIAERHGFSVAAVRVMLTAVARGGGRMAQFEHPEFGGGGQWMRGGMTMLGAMFDSALKARVERFCDELASVVAGAAFAAGGSHPYARDGAFDMRFAQQPWWPSGLGSPDSTGTQNDARYAYFAQPRRLVIEIAGRRAVYDTLDHRIGGIAQAQSATGTLRFTSQHGTVDIATLPVVAEPAEPASADDPAPGDSTSQRNDVARLGRNSEQLNDRAGDENQATRSAVAPHDIIVTIERLGELRRGGSLTEAEFQAKKTELLGRL